MAVDPLLNQYKDLEICFRAVLVNPDSMEENLQNTSNDLRPIFDAYFIAIQRYLNSYEKSKRELDKKTVLRASINETNTEKNIKLNFAIATNLINFIERNSARKKAMQNLCGYI